mmetsp:Transcript_8730/g.25395  ORF Transcript_8730/g.25395 Transcript_8730/m.25395 type:complete len:240 (+) Transcript_8730:308-1027(+)
MWRRPSSRDSLGGPRRRRCAATPWPTAWAAAASRSPSRPTTCTSRASSRTSSRPSRPSSCHSLPRPRFSAAASWTATRAGPSSVRRWTTARPRSAGLRTSPWTSRPSSRPSRARACGASPSRAIHPSATTSTTAPQHACTTSPTPSRSSPTWATRWTRSLRRPCWRRASTSPWRGTWPSSSPGIPSSSSATAWTWTTPRRRSTSSRCSRPTGTRCAGSPRPPWTRPSAGAPSSAPWRCR